MERRRALKAQHKNGNGFGLTLGMAASLAPWPTPGAQVLDPKPNIVWPKTSKADPQVGLADVAAMVAPWATPTASEKVRSEDFQEGRTLTAREALGPKSSGFPAEMGKPGQLNPAFSLWLMGYPTEWALCAAQATRSARKRQPSSSARGAR